MELCDRELNTLEEIKAPSMHTKAPGPSPQPACGGPESTCPAEGGRSAGLCLLDSIPTHPASLLSLVVVPIVRLLI